jgi:hypothetical protein
VTWCLNFATYKDLIEPNVCSCCAGPLSPTGSELDRIDAAEPFSETNVVPICGSCRAVRGFALSLEEPKLIVERRQTIKLAVA